MADHDLNRFIFSKCAKRGVEYDNLDDDIKALIDELATDALDAKRMEGVLAPPPDTEDRIEYFVPKTSKFP